MDKEKTTTEELSPEIKEILARVKASLQKEVEEGKKYGFDVKAHWDEMLASLDEEKAEKE